MTRSTRSTPLGAALRGALAGMAGCATMDAWFAAFGKLMPPPRDGAFVPPERQQLTEMPPETIARRVVGSVAMRGTLEGKAKYRAGRAVHYLYGAGWGALYGMLAETLPPVGRVPGAYAFGALVWSASDHLILPLLRLGPWPSGVTPKGHAFWLASHFAWASGVGPAYRTLQPRALKKPGVIDTIAAASVLARVVPLRKLAIAKLALRAARPLFARRRGFLARTPLFT